MFPQKEYRISLKIIAFLEDLNVIWVKFYLCYDAAHDQCRASVLNEINKLVKANTCMDEDGNIITNLFTIFDTEIGNAKNECDDNQGLFINSM